MFGMAYVILARRSVALIRLAGKSSKECRVGQRNVAFGMHVR